MPINIKITNDVGQIDSIKIINLDTGDTYYVTPTAKETSYNVRKNGTYKVEVKATTDGVQETGEKTITVGKISVTFTKAQGKIDIIWVGTDNKRRETPLEPVVLNGMKKVYWKKEDGTEVKKGDPEFIENEWYKYEAGDNIEDSKNSNWANAINTKDENDGYFVWIPRYAYRIIYFTADGQVSGYCDGKGERDVLDTPENRKRTKTWNRNSNIQWN